MTMRERFWSKVDCGDDDECWVWQATTTRGYGRFSIEATPRPAHRVAYRLEVEEPGDDLVLHHCDNRACVNPNHLYLGDQEDNMEDMFERGRNNHVSEEEHPQSKLTRKAVSHIKWDLEETDKTHRELGERYDVSSTTIGEISRGATWTEVSKEKP